MPKKKTKMIQKKVVVKGRGSGRRYKNTFKSVKTHGPKRKY